MIPVFSTERLLLRGVELTDIPSYQKHFNNYAVISQLSALVPWPIPEDGVEKFLKESILPRQGRDRWMWGIFLKTKSDDLIGAIDLWRTGIPEHRGFWLSQKFWGQGIMTEAIPPILDYAFNNLGFEVLVFSNAVGNEKSRRIKQKTGATLIGTRPAKFVDKACTEAETWELTKANWIKYKESTSGGKK